MIDFLKNAWYVAAWDFELSDALLPRQFLNDRVLLYRASDGAPVAIGNVCPHRFAPLNMGKRVGDAVECGYHGLRFDRSGACILNPHGTGAVPAAARVASYPVIERHGIIWIWMGNAGRADESAIPDLGHLADPALRTIRGSKSIKANYELIIDNLMDPSHAQFVHASLAETSSYGGTKANMRQENDRVTLGLSMPDSDVPRSWQTYISPPPPRADLWVEFTWCAPSIVENRTGLTPAGRPREEGAEKRASHLVTPATDSASHYFFAHTRSFRMDDPAVDEAIETWQRVAFSEQDAPMIEACQSIIGDRSINDLGPVMLSTDAAVVRWRRVLQARIDAERQEASERSADARAA